MFASLVAAAGAATFVVALGSWAAPAGPALYVCLSLAVLAATFKVAVPGMRGTISPVNVPILFAAGTLSWQETMVVAATAGVVQCLWRAQTRPAAVQVAFNGAVMGMAATLARQVACAAAPADGSWVFYIVAAIVLQLVNALAVSTVLSLLDGISLRGLWRNCHLWSFPYELVAGAFAGLWAHSNLSAGFQMSVLGAILLYLMSMFYRDVVERYASDKP